MKKLTLALTAILLSTVLATAEDAKMKKGKADAAMPIHCPTAESAIRVLNSEKEYVKKQTVSGVFSVTPIGFLTNTVTSQSDTQKMEIKKYDKLLDDKIAEIKKKCHIK